MIQFFPHQMVHLDLGAGLELIDQTTKPFIHFSVTFASGPKIQYELRKKKTELPKPPPLEELLE